MSPADHKAVSALARHFAYDDGGIWDHLDPRQQATYRARALDVVQVVGPIYQPAVTVTPHLAPPDAYMTATFPRPMSKEHDR
jgi:hypothetical protein